MKLICRKYYFENCNIVFKTINDIKNNINNIKIYDIVGIQRDILDEFIKHCNLTVKCYIHIIDCHKSSCCKSNGYKNHLEFLESEYIIKLYSENWIGPTHNKLEILPIGFSSNKINILENYIKNSKILSFFEKTKNISSTFHHVLHNKKKCAWNRKLSDRQDVYNLFLNNHLIDFLPKLSYTEYLKHYNNYKFTISPTGNGLDCHRTYEAIILNTIPIVKTGPLDKMYKQYDLPVVIVNDWSDITENNLEIWTNKIGKLFKNPNKYIKLLVENFICISRI